VTFAPAEAFTRLLEGLDRLELRHMVGGSTASAVHGHVRMTRDIDIVAGIRPHDAEPLAEELRQDFYVDAGQIRIAIEAGRSFNVIHL